MGVAGARVLGAAWWTGLIPVPMRPGLALPPTCMCPLLCPLVSGLNLIRVPAFIHAVQLVLVVRLPALHLPIASNPTQLATQLRRTHR